MQAEDYGHWLEVIVGALVGLGGWLWRIGRKYQQHEDRISHLEQETGDDRNKRRRMYERLEEIGREQAVQGVKIDHIADETTRIRERLDHTGVTE